MARALTERIERYDAIDLIETGERLGVSIHADGGWDALSISVEVPTARLEPALELVPEVLPHPTFAADEFDRLRDERLNDLLRAQTDPRRRAIRLCHDDRRAIGHTRVRSIHGEPRERIEAVDVEAEAASAGAHLHVDNAVVVLVGDVDAFDGALGAASSAPVEIERDPSPEPPVTAEQDEAPGPFDKDDEEGPTAGAEEPELPGVPTEPAETDYAAAVPSCSVPGLRRGGWAAHEQPLRVEVHEACRQTAEDQTQHAW